MDNPKHNAQITAESGLDYYDQNQRIHRKFNRRRFRYGNDIWKVVETFIAPPVAGDKVAADVPYRVMAQNSLGERREFMWNEIWNCFLFRDI